MKLKTNDEGKKRDKIIAENGSPLLYFILC